MPDVKRISEANEVVAIDDDHNTRDLPEHPTPRSMCPELIRYKRTAKAKRDLEIERLAKAWRDYTSGDEDSFNLARALDAAVLKLTNAQQSVDYRPFIR